MKIYTSADTGNYNTNNSQHIKHNIITIINLLTNNTSITYNIIIKQATYTENKLSEQLFSTLNSGFPVSRLCQGIEAESRYL